MKILFITQICPYPPTNGGAIKTYNILKHLGSRHDVSLLTFIRDEKEIPLLAHLSPYCKRIEFGRIRRSGALNARIAAASLLLGRSFIVSRDRSDEMRAKMLDELRQKPDLIYVDHLQMFQFVPRDPPCPVVLDEHNVEWRIIERFAGTGTSAMGAAGKLYASIEWKRLRDYELGACMRADLVIAVTPDDRQVLVSHGVPGEKITVLPIGVDTDYFRPLTSSPGDRKVLSFGTMSWPPNIDAAGYFAESIFPGIKKRVPDARLSLVGANPPPEVRKLSERDPSIEVTGFVEDIRDASRNTAAFVTPLRIGSGMRVKILDAMAMALPVVTTSIGCEGIAVEPGRDALVADSPDDFAESVVSLLLDHELRTRLGLSGRQLVESRYSWPPILSRLDEMLSAFD